MIAFTPGAAVSISWPQRRRSGSGCKPGRRRVSAYGPFDVVARARRAGGPATQGRHLAVAVQSSARAIRRPVVSRMSPQGFASIGPAFFGDARREGEDEETRSASGISTADRIVLTYRNGEQTQKSNGHRSDCRRCGRSQPDRSRRLSCDCADLPDARLSDPEDQRPGRARDLPDRDRLPKHHAEHLHHQRVPRGDSVLARTQAGGRNQTTQRALLRATGQTGTAGVRRRLLPALPFTRTSVPCGHRSGRLRPEQHAVRAILDPAGRRLLLSCDRVPARDQRQGFGQRPLVGDGSRCLGALQRTCVRRGAAQTDLPTTAFAWLMLIRSKLIRSALDWRGVASIAVLEP